MKSAYNLGKIAALEKLGMLKVGNPMMAQLAASQMAGMPLPPVGNPMPPLGMAIPGKQPEPLMSAVPSYSPAPIDPSMQELQSVTEAKITEKDIEGAAKIVQVMAQMKQTADEAGMAPAEPTSQNSKGAV